MENINTFTRPIFSFLEELGWCLLHFSSSPMIGRVIQLVTNFVEQDNTPHVNIVCHVFQGWRDGIDLRNVITFSIARDVLLP